MFMPIRKVRTKGNQVVKKGQNFMHTIINYGITLKKYQMKFSYNTIPEDSPNSKKECVSTQFTAIFEALRYIWQKIRLSGQKSQKEM